MKVRPIESADELHAVYDFIAAAAPDWGNGSGRGRDYFDRKIAEDTAVFVAAEDSSGVVAASLASLDGSSLVHADEYISRGIDSAWYRRQVVDHISMLNVARHIEDATGVLAHAYRVRSMRHLFHNRQEVTALLQRREEIADGWESSVVPRGAARR